MIKTPTSEDIIIGAELHALRVRRGMSQSVLAEQLGLTFQQIQKYEKGVNRISVGRLYRICKLFKVSPLHFFDKIGVIETSNAPDPLSDDVLKLAFAIDQEKDEGRRAHIISVARSCLSSLPKVTT